MIYGCPHLTGIEQVLVARNMGLGGVEKIPLGFARGFMELTSSLHNRFSL